MNISLRTLLPTTAMLVAGLGLAACGSSSSSSSSTTTTKAAKPAATTAAVIKTTKNPNLGTILVDGASGKTVYTLTKNGAAVACTGSCLSVWPPVMLPAGSSTATGGAGVSGLTVVSATGGQQVADKGLPLYTFSGDAAAGDAAGDGLSSFGGTWHVVTVGKAAAPAASTTTTSSSGSGY